MALRIRTFYSAILSSILTFLGFTGCSDPVDEYGTPSAEYKISGKVVSEDAPDVSIKGIQVTMEESNSQTEGKTMTDEKGNFVLQKHDFPIDKQTIRIQDVDGKENGWYQDIEIEIEFEKEDYKGGNGWFEGRAEKDLGTIKLSTKKEEGPKK